MKLGYKISLTAVFFFLCLNCKANSTPDFDTHFNDSTLRLDYIFAGDSHSFGISLDSKSKQPGWAGRRKNLSKTPLKGNGTILVTSLETGDTLYMNPFSSLFQEWIYTPEALKETQSFENSFLVPLPKKKAKITIELRGNRHEVIATTNHVYDPADELTKEVGTRSLPNKYLHRGGDSKNVIDVAILAEGYQEEEMDKFLQRSQDIVNEILSYEPFASNKEKFNFVAVMTPSNDSGVSIPLKKQWKDTNFESHFSTFHSARYLTCPRVKKLHQSLEGIPYEHILLLVNTEEYGGGGIYNSYQIASSDNKFTLPVAVHEFGHSFAGLADEYFYSEEDSDDIVDNTYPIDIEPWEKNITTLVDFDSKWKDLLQDTKIKEEPDFEGQLGIFKGGGYRSNGIYRPTYTCRMRDNFYPTFCPVCKETLREVIEFYTE